MTTIIPELTKTLRTVVGLNYRDGDAVVILADFGSDPDIVTALATAVMEKTSNFSLVTEPLTVGRHTHEPRPTTAKALAEATLVFSIISRGLGYSDVWQRLAREKQGGIRLIAMDQGLNKQMLLSGPGRADYQAIQDRAEAIKALFDRGSEVRLESALGSRFTASIKDRIGIVEAAKAGRFANGFFHGAAFPGGEVFIAPVEGSGNGTLIFDASIQYPIGRLNTPLKVEIENGQARSFEGGAEAERFESYLRDSGDEHSFNCPAEFAIGLNEGCTITGEPRTDRKALGTMHVAFGNSAMMGGTVHSKLHVDAVMKNPTIWIDDTLVVKAGELAHFG